MNQKLQIEISQIRKFGKTISGCFWTFWLVFTLLIGNALQTLTLIVWPFSRKIFKNLNRTVARVWWSFLVYVVEKKNKIKITFWGEKVPERENAIVISNHQCMSDIPTIMTLAIRKYRIGDLKFFVKDILKYVPGVGWGMLFLDCLFVKRNWLRDRDSIRRTFSSIRNYKVPIWLVSFLEGTRLTKSKLLSSQSYAQERQTWTPRHVLIPRTKGFVATVQGLREHVQAIYDLTIGYPDGVPSLWQLIMGLVPALHIHVRRIDIKDLPHEAKELSQWVLASFREKDQLLEFYYQNGVFKGDVIST